MTRADATIIVDALGQEGRRRLGLLAVLTLFGAVAEYATLIALLTLLRSWLAPRGGGIDIGAATLFGAAVLSAGGLRYVILVRTQRLAFDTGHRLLVAVQRRLLAREWIAHSSARSSEKLAAVEQVDQLVYGLLLPLLQAGASLVLGLAILAALLAIDPRTAITAALMLGLLFVGAVRLFRPMMRRAGAAIGRGWEARIEVLQNHDGAIRELILGGQRRAAAEQFRAIDRQLADTKAHMTIASAAPRLMVETVGLLCLIAIAWWLTARTGSLTVALPTLAALALGAQRLLPLAQGLAQAISGIAANASTAQTVARLLQEPDLQEGPLPPPLPFTSEIRLQGLAFHYPGRKRAAVEAIDLVIARGERVALTGRNGSGKSTLADLVMGLLEPGAGSLTVDGCTIDATRRVAWQRNIAHVPQAPWLADSSIAANIAFMDGAPDAGRIAEAARLAGLEPLIASLAEGLETRIGSGGILLSGGQRQRVALARALYDPKPLLVLDEATSALDRDSEAQVRLALDALQARGTTIVLIAHRSGLLDDAARIIRLDGGRIVSDQAASARPAAG